MAARPRPLPAPSCTASTVPGLQPCARRLGRADNWSRAHQVQRLLRVLVERCPRQAREEVEAFLRGQKRDQVDHDRRHHSHHSLATHGGEHAKDVSADERSRTKECCGVWVVPWARDVCGLLLRLVSKLSELVRLPSPALTHSLGRPTRIRGHRS